MARKKKPLVAYGYHILAGDGNTIEIHQQMPGQSPQKVIFSKDQTGSLTEMLETVKEEIENPPDEDDEEDDDEDA